MKSFLKGISISVVAGLVVWFAAAHIFTQSQAILLGIVTFLVILWTNETLPTGVVSLLPLILFPLFNIMPMKQFSIVYSKPITFLFIGGFLVAMAFERTGLHRYLANKLLTIFPKTPIGITYALMLTSGILSSFMSNTTTTLMLVPIAMHIADIPILQQTFLLAIAYGSSIGGVLTPIGTPPNLIFMGFMESHAGVNISFIKWMLLTAPIVGAMMLITPLILSKGLPKFIPPTPRIMTITPKQNRMLAIVVLMLIALVLASILKKYKYPIFNEKVILLFFGVLMFVPGIGFLSWKEDFKYFPFEILFLFGAGFSIAKAFTVTGLDKALTEHISFISTLPYPLILLSVALLVGLTTSITSNTALASVILPIFYEFATRYSINPITLLLLATVSASFAFLLPISTPPNAIIMASGAVKIKTMVKKGLILVIVGAFISTAIAYFIW